MEVDVATREFGAVLACHSAVCFGECEELVVNFGVCAMQSRFLDTQEQAFSKMGVSVQGQAWPKDARDSHLIDT